MWRFLVSWWRRSESLKNPVWLIYREKLSVKGPPQIMLLEGIEKLEE